MENNIQELTNKIYLEGIEKAEKNSEDILKSAQEKAAGLVADAKKEAESIHSKALKEAEALKKNTDSDLKLAYDQAISALKQKIKDLISLKILEEDVKKAFVDEKFLKQVILELIQKWDATSDIAVSLSESIKEKLDKNFEKSIMSSVEGLEIKYEKSIKGGFKIERKAQGFQITFTDEDFIEFFKPFIKEKAEKMLF